MSDYINFIDSASIELAELAFEIGDYKCALDKYARALDLLAKYNGKQMHPIQLKESLTQKSEESKLNLSLGKSILIYESWELTKSSFVKGNQCVKSLYLDKFKRNEKNPISEEKKSIFKKGHSFEDQVRELIFPEGINVKDKVKNFKYFNSYTNYLIENPNAKIIYEASIIEDLLLVMCDVLVKREDGKLDFYEIKMNTEVNEAIKSDLAIQYSICKKRFGDKLNSFNLILRVKDEGKPYRIIDMTNDLSKKTGAVEKQISKFKEVLGLQEPIISMSNHCLTPYECEFTNYCQKKII